MNAPDPSADPNLDPRAADAAAEALDARSDLERWEAEVREANERALRSHAELENFRKRSRRELEDEKRYAALPMARDMLAVLDNLQRAIEAAERTASGGPLLEGVKMVAVQFTSILEQHHVRPIPAAGAEFDPNVHEAIGQMPSVEAPAGRVAHVARAGYMLHERVVRPAQVLVSTGAPAAPAAE